MAYAIFNGGEVKKSKKYKDKNYKYYVKSRNKDGSIGVTNASSWENSKVKVSVEGEFSISISHGLNSVKDVGIAGYSVRGPSVTTKYNIISIDRGVGYGNEYDNTKYHDVEKIAGIRSDGTTYGITQMSARMESEFDLKMAFKKRYDFKTKKWVDIQEYGIGAPFLEAKYSSYSNGGGKVRLGAQEEVGHSLGLFNSVKFNMRYQIVFKW